MSRNILDRAIALLGSDIVLSLLIKEEKTLEKLETWFPSLTGVEDQSFEQRLWLLTHDSELFILVVPHVSSLPDIRPISETTRQAMQIREWNPWNELQEEYERMEDLNVEGQLLACYFLYKLLNTPYDSTRSMWKRQLYEKYFTEGSLITKPSIKGHLPLREMSGYDLLDFLVSYPILSYLLCSEPNGLPFLLAGPSARRIVELYNQKYRLWQYANLVKEKHLLDLLFVGRDVEELLDLFEYGKSANSLVRTWLVVRRPDKRLVEQIVKAKDTQAFAAMKVTDPSGILPILIANDGLEFLPLLGEIKEIPHHLCHLFVGNEKWREAIPAFQVHRYCKGKEKDLLKIAIEQEDKNFFVALRKKEEDIVTPIELSRGTRPPLAHAYSMSAEIGRFMKQFYEVGYVDLLIWALDISNAKMVNALLEENPPEADVLLVLFTGRSALLKYMEKIEYTHPKEWALKK